MADIGRYMFQLLVADTTQGAVNPTIRIVENPWWYVCGREFMFGCLPGRSVGDMHYHFISILR